MNLTRANKSDLRKVTVKIECSNKNEKGSGTIVNIKGTFYVLTAAHVIENDKIKGPYGNDQIVVSIRRNSQRFYFTVRDVVYYDRDNDAAVILVENSNNMPISGLDKVKLLTSDPSGLAVLCGFHNEDESPSHYYFENRRENTWALVNFQLREQRLGPVTNFEGTSGGGLFYQDTDKNLYMIAYMSELGRHDGNNNEFICYPSAFFIASDVLDSIVCKHEFNYIDDSGDASYVDSRILLKPLDRSGYELNQTGAFLENSRTKEIISQLRNDEEPTLLITALSGMGKTKLIYEAFKDTEREPNRYYAKYNNNREQLIGELKQILSSNYDNDGIIIIDDCPMELVSDVISIRNRYNMQFRLIMAHHDYFNEELERVSFPVIKLRPKEMEERIAIYISEQFHENEYNKNDISEIKRLADGYPQMAIELVKAYKDNDSVGPDAVAYLMPKLLNITEGKRIEEMKIWQTLSLCMPFPYKDGTHQGFKFLIEDNLVTPLNGMEYGERRSIAGELVRKYSPTFIDVQGMWLHVRPFPLAVWLTSEWFRTVCNLPIHFKELIEHLMQQPDEVQNAISVGFCKHIQQMSGNKEAFKMVEKLVNADINHPFFNEENLCSGLGSKLFLAMSTVNPSAISACLRRVLGCKDNKWLKENFVGNGRRNIVWALERLCFARESYHDSVIMMAKLAAAENEEISNNASGQLVQLFHIALAGTEVDLKERLGTLKQLVKAGDDYNSVLARCFEAAFRNGGFSKIGGAEKFGFESRKDYMPQTWKEVLEYWHGCRDLLLDWMSEKPAVVDLIADMVENNAYHWVHEGQKNILIPLMEEIANKKNYRWDSGYEALAKAVYSFGIDAESIGVNELMNKLRNGLFMTKIKDARYTLHGKYHLSDKKQIELIQGLFIPLADEFLQKELYLNIDEVKALLEDKEYIPFEFNRRVVTFAKDEQLNCFYNTVYSVIKTKPDDFYSPFLGNFSYESRDREPLKTFLDSLRDLGRELLYVSLMAGTEDDSLNHFYRLFDEQTNGTLKQDFLRVYLRFFRSNSNERYLLMLKALSSYYPDRSNDLVSYVVCERFMMRSDEHPEAKAIVKEALLKYQINSDNGGLLNDYSQILIEVLQQWHDQEFAQKINHKMIEVYNTQMAHMSTEGIFTELLKDYFDVVWPDFIKAFLSDDYFLFYYQVKDELGSGIGHGKGPLFDLDENLIKQICLDNPKSAPARIASMVPCFEVDNNKNEIRHFNKWIIWLLDNFGEQKDVRSGISSNLGTFSWSDKLSPYYERNIKCFEQLLDHNKQEVRDWAQKSIKEERMLLEMEKNNEDFMKIRYEM